LVIKRGKTKFYSKELKRSLIEARCQEAGLDKDIFLAIRKNESANGKYLFGFDFVAKVTKDETGKKHLKYVYKKNKSGKIHKLTAVGDYHINPLAHNAKVRDLIDYNNNLTKAISHVKFLHKRYNGDLGLMASAYVAGTNGNHKTQEVIRYRDAVVSTFRTLKNDAIKDSIQLAQR
jgi:hypothetical protein